uniref:Uncharacterized protein n=1 Tax=Sphaerodactylus townsendi TaxID=933632 RepID=A0ACB8G5J5_9SAUR
MGNNHSKPCSGVPEREFRRAEQEWIQQLYFPPRVWEPLSETPPDSVHIYCREDEVDQYLEQTDATCVTFHFKVVEPPEEKPKNSLEGGGTPSLVEKPKAAAIPSAVLVGATVAESGKDAGVKSEPGREVLVRSHPNGDLMVATDAQPTELDLPLACLCNQVVHALHIVKKSSGDSSERTKERPAVEDLLPSSAESQFSTSSSQTIGPLVGVAESLTAGDVRQPNEETSLVNDRKALCESDLAMKDALDKPATRQMQFDDDSEETSDASSEETLDASSDETIGASSEETIEEVDEAPNDLVSAETSEVCNGSKSNTGTVELAETLPVPQAVSEAPSILNEMDKQMPGDYCDMENTGTRSETLQKGGQHLTADSEDKMELPIASKIIRTRVFACLAHKMPSHATSKKINADDVILAGDAIDLDYLQKDGAIPTPEVMKVGKCQTPVDQNIEALRPADVGKMSQEPSSAGVLLETVATGTAEPLKDARPVLLSPSYHFLIKVSRFVPDSGGVWCWNSNMGIMNSKRRPDVPASEYPRAEQERTAEIHGSQPANETSLDMAQMTSQIHRVGDGRQPPTQEENECHLPLSSEGTERQGPREFSQGGPETQSFAGTSGSSEVTHGFLEEGEIAPGHIDLIDKLMAESEAPSTRSSGDSSEGSTSTLDYLYSSLMSEPEPWISEELAQVLLPPVEMLDSGEAVKEPQPCKNFKETYTDVLVEEGAGEQASSHATQPPPLPERVCISDPASPKVLVCKETGEEHAEVPDGSRALATQEEGKNRMTNSQKQETVVESPHPIPSSFRVNLDAPLLTWADTDLVEDGNMAL